MGITLPPYCLGGRGCRLSSAEVGFLAPACSAVSWSTVLSLCGHGCVGVACHAHGPAVDGVVLDTPRVSCQETHHSLGAFAVVVQEVHAAAAAVSGETTVPVASVVTVSVLTATMITSVVAPAIGEIARTEMAGSDDDAAAASDLSWPAADVVPEHDVTLTIAAILPRLH